MGRNCSLRIVPAVYDSNHRSRAREEQEELISVFHNRSVSVCDVRQLQARAIVSLASKEFEEKMKSILGSEPLLDSLPLSRSPLYYLTNGNYTGLSMKRSLQRFLQTRKRRVQSTAPYNL